MKALLGTPRVPADWSGLVEEHARAVDEYCRVAGGLGSTRWMAPISPGKWSPAEITAHVAEAYRVLTGELSGGAGMGLRGSRLQRLVLRHTILPRLLAGRPFPPGVPAPRETRPREIIADPGLAVSMLAEQAERFARDLTDKAGRQTVQLTHAYFGRLSARQGLELSIRHTRHHAQQLAAIDRSPLPS